MNIESYNKIGDKMKQMKVAVYAICKNEAKFVKKFMEHAKEADYVVVLDTGSTDNTVEKLKNEGAIVYQEIFTPWRFDVARNRSLDHVPEDVDLCVCLDLDEVICSGWRKKLEKLWNQKTDRLEYPYHWSFDSYGKPATSFYIQKIHTRKNYRWTHPVHEVLTYMGKGKEQIQHTDAIVVDHYPDTKKSRGSYLPLLELSVKEDPEDDRNMHYLGREYLYYGKWNECIDTLQRHLSLPKATWKEERAASMRYIARSYLHLKRIEEAKMWYQKAIEECPYTREAYVELAELYYTNSDWEKVEFYLEKALEIKERGKSYINENFCWDSTIDDLLSLAKFYLGKKEESLKHLHLALEKDPDNKRIQENLILVERANTGQND